MNIELSYIKHGAKYIIGAVVFITSLSCYSFGGAPKEYKALGQSLKERAIIKGLEKDDEGYYKIGSSAEVKRICKFSEWK